MLIVFNGFSEALPVLQRFVPRKVNLRGQKFYLELGIDLKVPLQMYKKIQTTDFKLAAEKYALLTGVQVIFLLIVKIQTFLVVICNKVLPTVFLQLKRKTVYEKYVKDEEVGDSVTTVDADTNRSDNLSQGPKTFEGEIVKGYFSVIACVYKEFS